MRQPHPVTPAHHQASAAVPLCVDLDGTLVRTDLLVEAIFVLLRINLLYLFLMPVWGLKGKAYFKHQIAQRVSLDVTSLPYHMPFLRYLNEQHAHGRRLVLASAANVTFAQQIAVYLGLFDLVLASDATTNLSGTSKLRKLQEMLPGEAFDYAGNGRLDLKVWRHARKAILVNPTPGVRRAATRIADVDQVFDDTRAGLKTYLKSIRLHQWLKNLLVFVPLLMAHQVGDVRLVMQAALAFLGFGLCASSVYVLNDLLDLPDDRQHPSKRHRPLASGTLPIFTAVLLIPAFLLAACSMAWFLPSQFVALLLVYYVTTLAYSLRLKRVVMLDVLVLAALYTWRIVAGAAAVAVPLSFWLLAFSVFLFLSLALVKRYTELRLLQNEGKTAVQGRGYQTIDMETLAQFGSSSGYLAVLVLALYINSDHVRTLYTQPQVIWLLCPLILYWISRIWLLARRGRLQDDPLVFAIKDRNSHGIAGLALIILWMAM